MLRSTALPAPEPENCSLTGRSSRPAPAGSVSPVRGTRCIIAYRAYAACLHGSAQLNVRPRVGHSAALHRFFSGVCSGPAARGYASAVFLRPPRGLASDPAPWFKSNSASTSPLQAPAAASASALRLPSRAAAQERRPPQKSWNPGLPPSAARRAPCIAA
jgi:hypothetical protein